MAARAFPRVKAIRALVVGSLLIPEEISEG
jgi:hypothetical protein